jgi:hypothetical protein
MKHLKHGCSLHPRYPQFVLMMCLPLSPCSLAAQEALQEGLTDELVQMAAAMKARALQTQVMNGSQGLGSSPGGALLAG